MITKVLFSGDKGGRCVRLRTLPPSCAVVMKSGNLNFLEPSGPLQACNGTALLLPLYYYYYYYYYYYLIIVSCHRSFLPGTSLEPAVIPTAQASSFTLQYFPYYV